MAQAIYYTDKKQHEVFAAKCRKHFVSMSQIIGIAIKRFIENPEVFIDGDIPLPKILTDKKK